MNFIPSIIEKNGNSKEFACDIFSKMLDMRIIFLNGEITDTVADTIICELLYLDSLNNEDICMYINSPGGSVCAGLAIYDTMNFINSDVSTICIGQCASMAAVLLSSGKKGKRLSLKNAEMMIHQPIGGIEGQVTDIKIHTDRILKTKDTINNILADNCNKTLAKVEQDTERDYFMSALEAKRYGLIDRVI